MVTSASKPILNIGKISDGRYKFSFLTDEGTMFCEVSVTKDIDASLSDEQKKAEAIIKMKRLLTEIDKVIKDME